MKQENLNGENLHWGSKNRLNSYMIFFVLSDSTMSKFATQNKFNNTN